MAARRLGGSLLHGAQAVVAEERRQLVPRRFLSGVNKPQGLEPKGAVQQKKEELYELMADADKQFTPKTHNRRLLQYLSLHVEPRPDDPLWSWLSSSTKFNTWLRRAGITSCYIGTCLIIVGQAGPAIAHKRAAEQKGLA